MLTPFLMLQSSVHLTVFVTEAYLLSSSNIKHILRSDVQKHYMNLDLIKFHVQKSLGDHAVDLLKKIKKKTDLLVLTYVTILPRSSFPLSLPSATVKRLKSWNILTSLFLPQRWTWPFTLHLIWLTHLCLWLAQSNFMEDPLTFITRYSLYNLLN